MLGKDFYGEEGAAFSQRGGRDFLGGGLTSPSPCFRLLHTYTRPVTFTRNTLISSSRHGKI